MNLGTSSVNSADTFSKGGFDRPLNILQIAHKYPPFIGGIEMHTREISVRLARKGHKVTVLTGDPFKKLPAEEMDEGVRILRFPVYPAKSDVYFGPGLSRLMRREKWDVAHVQGYHTLVPPLALATAHYCGRPFVMTFHSGGSTSNARKAMRGIQQAILRPLIARADQLIAVSEFEAGSFAERLELPRDRFTVVPNGAEIVPPATPVERAPADSPLILSIGRFERYKGHHRVISAFAKFVKDHPNARLRIAGGGPVEDELRAQVTALGLDDKIEIKGVPPERREEMSALMSRASIVTLLSEYEAHPVAALEAISLGCKVIALNSTGFAEMARAGALRGIDPASTDDDIARIMAEEIGRTLNPSAIPKIGTWDDCAGRLLDIYERVIIRRRSSRETSTSGSSRTAAA